MRYELRGRGATDGYHADEWAEKFIEITEEALQQKVDRLQRDPLFVKGSIKLYRQIDFKLTEMIGPKITLTE